jgi:hypothetical protein
MTEYFHKVIGLVDGEEMVMVLPVNECESLKSALIELIILHGVEEIYFAGTCSEDELEYFGNDSIEFEMGEFGIDDELDEELLTLTNKDTDDIIH